MQNGAYLFSLLSSLAESLYFQSTPLRPSLLPVTEPPFENVFSYLKEESQDQEFLQAMGDIEKKWQENSLEFHNNCQKEQPQILQYLKYAENSINGWEQQLSKKIQRFIDQSVDSTDLASIRQIIYAFSFLGKFIKKHYAEGLREGRFFDLIRENKYFDSVVFCHLNYEHHYFSWMYNYELKNILGNKSKFSEIIEKINKKLTHDKEKIKVWEKRLELSHRFSQKVSYHTQIADFYKKHYSNYDAHNQRCLQFYNKMMDNEDLYCEMQASFKNEIFATENKPLWKKWLDDGINALLYYGIGGSRLASPQPLPFLIDQSSTLLKFEFQNPFVISEKELLIHNNKKKPYSLEKYADYILKDELFKALQACWTLSQSLEKTSYDWALEKEYLKQYISVTDYLLSLQDTYFEEMINIKTSLTEDSLEKFKRTELIKKLSKLSLIYQNIIKEKNILKYSFTKRVYTTLNSEKDYLSRISRSTFRKFVRYFSDNKLFDDIPIYSTYVWELLKDLQEKKNFICSGKEKNKLLKNDSIRELSFNTLKATDLYSYSILLSTLDLSKKENLLLLQQNCFDNQKARLKTHYWQEEYEAISSVIKLFDVLNTIKEEKKGIDSFLNFDEITIKKIIDSNLLQISHANLTYYQKLLGEKAEDFKKLTEESLKSYSKRITTNLNLEKGIELSRYYKSLVTKINRWISEGNFLDQTKDLKEVILNANLIIKDIKKVLKEIKQEKEKFNNNLNSKIDTKENMSKQISIINNFF
jgi:hypothetical protein